MSERRAAWIAVCVLATAFFIQSLSSSLVKSPTYDEPVHIAAGLSYVETGRIIVNQEHPPLLKEMAGLFLRASGVRWPSNAQTAGLTDATRPPGNVAGTAIGNAIIASNGPDRVMFWSRLPLILLATGLVVVLFLVGRELVGSRAAVGAAFLYVLDPNILAHSFLVTTDAGLAAFLMLFLLALWRYLQRPGAMRLAAAGVTLGLTLGAKFSAVVVLPIAGMLVLAAAIWPIDADVAKAVSRRAKHGARTQQVGPGSRAWRYARGLVGMVIVACAIVEIIYLFPKDPLQYLAGLRLVNANHTAGVQAYMAGHLAPRFYSYFLVAYLLKEPLAAIALAGIGLAVIVRRANIRPLAMVFLLLPPCALFAGYTLSADNLGVRYIIPVLPFTCLLGGVGLVSMLERAPAWKRGVAAVLMLWLLVASAGIYPDHLSYFNEAACLLDDPKHVGLDGGSRCGPSWLDESNVDWGQGLKQLKTWLDVNAPGQPVRLTYFGTFPPQAYGLNQQPMDDADLIDGTRPGLYVVSAHVVASTPAVAASVRPGAAQWLRRVPPIAIVGHAFYIYRRKDER